VLSREDNEVLTNTDPGTPMGELFRRFWLPVMMVEELPAPDCVPVRVKVMNEDLIAFRDTQGRVGLIDAYCPHRGAAMFFGRNEHSGLRCIYHGWKFDVDGECVDMPNCPEGDTYRHKIHIRNYPTVEAGRLVWAYMGPKDRQPPFPQFQFNSLPDEHIYVSKFIVECNWVQSLDGAWDPSHGHFLHSVLGPGGTIGQTGVSGAGSGILPQTANPRLAGRAPISMPRSIPDFTKAYPPEQTETPNGAFMTELHETPDGKFRASTVPWHLPMFDGFGLGGPNIYSSNIRIPIDNKSIFWYRYRWSPEPLPQEYIWEYKHGGYVYPELVPGTFRTVANIHNDYQQDRVAQKQFTFSGIRCFPLQDIAMGENQWGPIADRTQEHLCSSDYHIIYWRRRLIKTAKALAQGVEPSEPFAAESFRNHNAMAIADTKEEALAQVHEKSQEWIVSQAPRTLAPALEATVAS
jgi:nitrite reductase/ring-hydroxylating ferredoxin subunit